MPMNNRPTAVQPDIMPVLSRGKHRNPHKGACFMEMASYLAGERWSDNPACTHPLLAALSRLINDNSTDAGRNQLAVLIPSVIGLNGDGTRWYALIARTAATAAFPESPAERQNALAVGLLTTERVLARLDERPPDSLSEETRTALDRAPHSERWARHYWHESDITPQAYIARAAPAILRFSVHGILTSTLGQPDRQLRELLIDTIAVCRTLMPAASHFEERQPNFGRTLNAVS